MAREDRMGDDEFGDISPEKLESYLAGVEYPANREEIINSAEEQGADEVLLNRLRGLPPMDFRSPSAVKEALA